MTLDRTIAPEAHQIEKISLPKIQKKILANKSELVLIAAGEQPVVKIEVVFEAGTRYESVNGQSFFAIKMLSEGTSTLSAAQIAETFDQFGASLELTHGVDRSSVSIFTLSKHLPTLLPVLKDLLFNSTFPEAELKQMKNIITQNLMVQQEKTAYVAGQVFKEKVFGLNHPLGVTLTPEAIQGIEKQQIIDFYEACIKQNNFTILLAGSFDDELIAQIEESFGSIEVQSKAINHVATPDATTQSIIIEKADALQSTIRLGRPLFSRKHPDFFPFLVMSDLLGGYFGSRLMKNIREDKGFTYGISASFVPFSDTAYWLVGTDVKKEATQQTLDEIHKEINILKTELVDDEELDLVKNYKIGAMAGGLNTPFEVADRVKMIHLNGLPEDFYETYIKNIIAISPEQVMEMANKYLVNLTEVVVGGK
jgi:zinc protease